MKQSIDQPSASYSVPSLRKTRPALWSVLWRWTALTSLGLVISSFVIAIIIGLLFGIEAEINDGFFITSMAAMAALPAGLCQWIFLHRRAKVSVWWIGATAAGAAVSILLAVVLWEPLQAQLRLGGTRLNDTTWSIMAWGMSGSIIGFGQWLVLREVLARSAWWISASAVGGVLAGVVPGLDYRHVAAYCLITGLTLGRLLAQPRFEASQP